ncbi:Uncharacterized protein FWK35_00014634 [Aphis craccivora]|uniref:Uncharacterized protein n=1 Tax=Aphis craccivora TaxID=307492 RepID=A0A6G0Z8D5_APHCR|nr:Uncharacterized protein FWK35_00014634 [Aphis craccivora]
MYAPLNVLSHRCGVSCITVTTERKRSLSLKTNALCAREGRKTGTHTRHHIQHKRSQSYAPVHTRCLEGPKNDGGVPPPQSPKKLGRWQCSKYTSGGGKYTGRRGSMTRGGKAVAGTMRGCPSLPPTAGGGAFGSILRLTFSWRGGVRGPDIGDGKRSSSLHVAYNQIFNILNHCLGEGAKLTQCRLVGGWVTMSFYI